MRGRSTLTALGLAALAFAARAQAPLPTITVSTPQGTPLIPFAREDLGGASRPSSLRSPGRRTGRKPPRGSGPCSDGSPERRTPGRHHRPRPRPAAARYRRGKDAQFLWLWGQEDFWRSPPLILRLAASIVDDHDDSLRPGALFPPYPDILENPAGGSGDIASHAHAGDEEIGALRPIFQRVGAIAEVRNIRALSA